MTPPTIRPIRRSDFDQVFELAKAAGSGMTNLPADEKALRGRIDNAVESFAAGATEPGKEVYLMVLEHDGELLGTTAVFSSIGLESGFVNYKVNWTFHASEQLGKRIKRRLLVPTHDFTGAGEVGSLFLSPNARGGGFGKFLARSRYLFIAQNDELIADPICAELRGWENEAGEHPFWNALGRHFFDMDFEEADVHNSAAGNQFIADLMPRFSIYVVLLPDDAKACIGRPHDGAKPAFEMLRKEGFEFNDYIDIFDGGPLVDAKKSKIKTIRDSVLRKVDIHAAPTQEATMHILAAGRVKDFRACKANAIVGDDRVTIDQTTADALGVGAGDDVRCVGW